jgi:glycosyltransferase involved in cell wall biosynthesis
LCGSNKWKGKIKFTYIGNFPKNIKFVNSKIINPLSNIYLAKELQKHDIYLTASNNDPGPSHHIEGALCGLPLLYKNSGGITESAKGYGVRFESANDFENSLSNLIQNYEKYEKKMKLFPYTKDKMCKQYLDLFKKILINRNNYYISRKKKYNFWYNLFFLLKFW